MMNLATSGLIGLGAGIAALGGGLAAMAAGIGVGRVGGQATEAMARQPDRTNEINRSMLITAALIEGVALFGCVIALLISNDLAGKLP